jgi:hypothetical protein
MDAIGASGEGSTAKVDVVVLADGEDRPAGGMRQGDRGEAVVAARRQVDDDAVHVRERRIERREGSHRQRVGPGSAHEVRQPGGPDEVVGQDGDARGQSSVSAR